MRWLLALVVVVAGGLGSMRAAGAQGFCTPDQAGTVCRASQGNCDPAEFCPAGGGACPADAKSTSQCRAAAGTCDVAESCNGSANTCPTDGFKPVGTSCRAVAGLCDKEETCTGTAQCPADAFETSGVCRAAVNDCDVAESCNGSGAACPANGFQPNDTPCDDGQSCTVDDKCQGGACQAGGPQLVAVPVEVDFPPALINGTPSTDQVVLNYRASGSLSITGITFTSAEYSLADSVTLPIALSSTTREATVGMEFLPTGLGNREGVLQLTVSPATCTPPSIVLSGEGLPPGVSMTPATVDFSQAMVDTTSATRDISVINLSDVTIDVTSVTLGDGTHFVLDATGLPQSLAVGSTYTFTVAAAPKALGVQTTSVVVTTNHPSFASLMTTLRVEATDQPPIPDGGVFPDGGGPGPGADPTEVLTPLSCKVQKGDGLAGFLVLVAFGLVLRSLYRRS